MVDLLSDRLAQRWLSTLSAPVCHRTLRHVVKLTPGQTDPRDSPFRQDDFGTQLFRNVDIMVGLVFASPHFVKSTLLVGKFQHDSFLAG